MSGAWSLGLSSPAVGLRSSRSTVKAVHRAATGAVARELPHAAARRGAITLTAAERTTLTRRVRGANTCWRDRLRAQVLLAAARGRPNARIAADLSISIDTARRWRGRTAARHLDGLADLPGLGGHGGSARRSGPRRPRWPASYPQPPGCRCPGGPARTWPPSRPSGIGQPDLGVVHPADPGPDL
jgi:Homeodomain-like domain